MVMRRIVAEKGKGGLKRKRWSKRKMERKKATRKRMRNGENKRKK